ncbi:non-ribosomal peptide synthetase, partial [Lysinibacillus sphaericus]
MENQYNLIENEVILQKTPFTFDVSVWELFWWFFVGAKVVFLTPDGEKNPESILQTIERHKITKIHFVPSMLQSFINYLQSSSKQWNLKSLNHVFTSGESLNSAHVNLFYQLIGNVYSVQLSNLYGPTEATVEVTYYNCTNDKKLVSIPIGKPISNIKIYILTSTKQMTPIGVAGELYISGAGVARGYLNQPEMTAEKFLPDPFNPGERMYRTGDLAKWLPDGNIEYLGRIDNQVKIRGYRIELGEVESRLSGISQIKEAVVTAPKDAMGTRYLCAYVVSDKKLHVAELKVELGQVLPSYMIPTRFIQIAKLPLTTNGKVDRKNLPDPTDIINDETNYMAPRTDIEKQLVEIWSDVLQIEKIGITDNFFDLGGHSLKATAFMAKIGKKLHITLALKEIFENPTIESISQII